MPLVSSIIPTSGRPQLLVRAIASVLTQTMPDFELIVVVDGPNPDTIAVLESIRDRRLRVVQNEATIGPGGSRNRGVAAAQGRWIAFLDDDDEWLPRKLELQLAAAMTAVHPVVVTCRNHIVTPLARYIWPRVIYDNVRPLDEYLFDRRSLFMGEVFLQTSSLLMSRELLLSFRFPAAWLHEDWELLLSVTKEGHARVVTLLEPLAIIYLEEHRKSLSTGSSWRTSLEWADANRHLIGPRGYSGFCLTIVGPVAARANDYQAFVPVLVRAFRGGAPRPLQIAFYLAAWVIPVGLRRRVRSWYTKERLRGAGGP